MRPWRRTYSLPTLSEKRAEYNSARMSPKEQKLKAEHPEVNAEGAEKGNF